MTQPLMKINVRTHVILLDIIIDIFRKPILLVGLLWAKSHHRPLSHACDGYHLSHCVRIDWPIALEKGFEES